MNLQPWICRRVPLLAALAAFVGCGGSTSGASRAAAGSAIVADDRPAVVAVTEEMGSPHPGDVAPDFELPDQNGTATKLSSLRGSIVVLSFVTSWCPFSRAEQPYLRRLAEQYMPRGVKFIAVDAKEPEADYRTFLGRVAMPFPVLRDDSGAVAASYAPGRALPDFTERYKVVVTSNLVLDPSGTIRFFGLLDLRNFDAAYVHVREVLEEMLAGGRAKT
jgi:peroxiredoxin